MKRGLLFYLLGLLVCTNVGCGGDNTDNAKDQGQSSGSTDNDGKDGATETNLAPAAGTKCDFSVFIPFCSSDHKAVNCSAFDGVAVEECSADQECVIGKNENFFGKKPAAECFKPCQKDDIGKEISICENGENHYYKCEEFNGKYYYSDYESYVYCDRGCNNEGTDCVKISDNEYAYCDDKNDETREMCEDDIRLECNYSRVYGSSDYMIYYAFDCAESGQTCARGKCVDKHAEDEYDDCDDNYKPYCSGVYQVYCGYQDYVVTYACDEGTECVEIDDELECLEPCTENEEGKHADICKYEYYQRGTTYRVCEKIGDKYYYVKKGWDECNGDCNTNGTACLSIHCTSFYDPKCSDIHTISYCEDDSLQFLTCDSGKECVDTGQYYPSCLEPCEDDKVEPKIVCECRDKNGVEDCWTYQYKCTQFGDAYYFNFDSVVMHCANSCNLQGDACQSDENKPES